MAILSSRDEQISVTCAILKDDVRKRFFAALRKKGGNPERIARVCDTGAGVVNNWITGSTKLPYNTLQMLAAEFNVALPEISELRKEYQIVSGGHKRKREPKRPVIPGPLPAEPSAGGPPQKPPQEPRREPEREPKRESKRTARRGRKAEKAAPRQDEAAKSPDKLTDDRAYWTGVLLGRAERDETHIRLAAGKRISQNFAATWAILTVKAFDVKPELAMSEDRSVQTATLPAASVAAFLDRIEFKPGTRPDSAPGAPRWVWSNPDWKKEFLKGLVDSCAQFQRTPALTLEGLSEQLAQSAVKMFASLELTAKIGDANKVTLEGADAVRKYVDEVGTRNPKLKDQIGSHFGTRPQGQNRGRSSGRRRGGRRRSQQSRKTQG
ncbi:MAG: hypothetical protein ABIJ96_07835 [Elusimicrobiota bacterium]